MQVSELMTSTVQSVMPDVSLRDAARTMRELNIGILPVVENNKLLGVITDRDICCHGIGEDRDPNLTKVKEIMSKDISTCFSDQDIKDVVKIMENKHLRRLAVIDHDNQIAGLFSVDDLARGSHELAGEVLASAAPLH